MLPERGRVLAAEVSSVIGYVGTDDFDADIALAEVGWTAVTLGWSLERSVERDWPQPDDSSSGRTPSRRQLLLHRLENVGSSPIAHERLPALASMLGEIYEAAEIAWGRDAGLPLAPSWRRPGAGIGS